MKSKHVILIPVLIMFCASAVHAGTVISRLEMDYGTSYKLAKFGQVLNPEAGKNLEPVYGFDGKAADNVMKKYRGKFKNSVKEPSYTLSIGKSEKRQP